MAEELEASLSLSVEEAARSIDELGDALVESLGSAADSFGTEMATAVASVPDVDIEFATPDASEVTGAIDTAVDAADTAVAVDADASAIPPSIDEAISSADTTIALEVDESGAQEATAAVQELTESLHEAEEAAPAATQSLDGLQDSATGLNAAAGLATGSTAGLSSAIGGMGGGAGIAVGAVAGVAGAVGMFFNEAVEATGSTQRFNSVLGDMASSVDNLELTGLNMDLSELALKLGSDDDKIRTVAARMFELATASGKSRDQANQFTQQLVSLGARAIALNPELGDVGSVTDRLSTAMTRGGRFASRYGLDLSSAEITSRALADTGKQTASELSFVEKSMAGAAIASEKYGDNLDKIIARGAENAITVQRRLKQTIVENIEALGMPFVAPIFEVMEKSVPAFEAAGRSVSVLAQAGLPVLITALEVATPLLQVMADVLEAIPTPALQAALALSQFGRITSAVTGGVGLVTTGLARFAPAATGVVAATTTMGHGFTTVAGHAATATAATGSYATGLHTFVAATPSSVSAASSLAGHFKSTGHAAAEVGTELTKASGTLPTTASGLAVVGKEAEVAAGSVSKTGTAIRSAGAHTGVLTAGAIGAGASLALLTSDSENANAGVLGLAASGAVMGAAFGGVGAPIGAVAGLVTGLGIAMFKGGQSVQDYRNEFRKLGSELEGLTAKQTFEKFVDSLGDMDKVLALGKGNVRAITDEIRALGSTSPAAAQKVADGFIKMRKEAGEPLSTKQIALLNEAVDDGAKKFGRANVEKEKDAATNERVAATAKANADATKAAGAAAAQAADQFAAANDALVQAATSGLPSIGGAWQELTGVVQQFGKDAVPNLDQFAAKLNEQADNLIAFPNRVTSVLKAGFPAIAAALTEMGPVAGAGLAQAVQAALIFGDNAALVKLNDSATKLKLGTMAIGPAIGEAAPSITTGMATAMEGMIPTIALIMGLSEAQVRAAIPGMTQAATTVALQAKDAYTLSLSELTPETQMQVQAAIETFGGYAPAMGAAGNAVGTEGAQNVQSGLAPAPGYAGAAGGDTASEFKSGLSPMPGEAGSVMSQTGVQIVSMANAIDTFNAGRAIGVSFTAGIALGIATSVGQVAGAAAAAVDAAKTAAENRAGISSPSKVFAEIGGYMGEGMQVGIENSTAGIMDAMRSAIQQTASLAARTSSSVYASGGGGAGGPVMVGPFNITVGNAADAQRAGAIIRDEAQRGVMNALTRRAAIIGARG